MAYFKKIEFNRQNGQLRIHKITVEGSTVVDNGVTTVDLVFEEGSSNCKKIEITEESTSAGDVFDYTISEVSIQSDLYKLVTPFGYIDDSNPGNYLMEMYFGKIQAQKTLVYELDVDPTNSNPPTQNVKVGRTEEFGVAFDLIGETDINMCDVAPGVYVAQANEIYMALQPNGTDENGNTLYDLMIQFKKTSS